MKLILSLLTVTLLSCAAQQPSDLTQWSHNEYRFFGKFQKAEYDKIIEIVQQHPKEKIVFYVTSHGGTSDDLFLAMDTLYQHGNVHWHSVNDCSSACAVLALSTRNAHGTFRLHSFYSHHHHKVMASPEFNERVLAKLKSYGYDVDELGYMFHSVEEMWPFDLEGSRISHHD